MKGSIWPILLLLATADISHAANLGTSQTLRAGALEIKISASPSVPRQAFYPLRVTYTNKGKQTIQMNDPLDCGLLWGIEDKTGPVPTPAGQLNYACPGSSAAPKTLAAGESYSGTMSAIIDKFPTGQYRIPVERLQRLRPYLYLPGTKGNQLTLTPPVQEIHFQIR